MQLYPACGHGGGKQHVGRQGVSSGMHSSVPAAHVWPPFVGSVPPGGQASGGQVPESTGGGDGQAAPVDETDHALALHVAVAGAITPLPQS